MQRALLGLAPAGLLEDMPRSLADGFQRRGLLETGRNYQPSIGLREAIPTMADFIVKNILPGASDIQAGMDSMDYARQSETAFGAGNYGEGLSKGLYGLLAAAGALPIIPNVARTVEKASSKLSDFLAKAPDFEARVLAKANVDGALTPQQAYDDFLASGDRWNWNEFTPAELRDIYGDDLPAGAHDAVKTGAERIVEIISPDAASARYVPANNAPDFGGWVENALHEQGWDGLLASGSLEELSLSQNTTAKRAAFEAAARQLGWAVDSSFGYGQVGSNYLYLRRGDDALKVRFADHANQTSLGKESADINVAPGSDDLLGGLGRLLSFGE